MSLLCAVCFFIHEFVPSGQTDNFTVAEEAFLAAKGERTSALDEIKSLAVGTEAYQNYIVKKDEADVLYNKYMDVVEADTFLGFTNFQQFLGEFGWALGLFIYALFNLFMAMHERKKHYAMMHSVLLFISIFYVYYVFQPFQDFSKLSYVAAAILSAVVIAFATHYYMRYAFEHVETLKRKVRVLIGFVAKNTAPKHKEEMWDVLEEVAK